MGIFKKAKDKVGTVTKGFKLEENVKDDAIGLAKKAKNMVPRPIRNVATDLKDMVTDVATDLKDMVEFYTGPEFVEVLEDVYVGLKDDAKKFIASRKGEKIQYYSAFVSSYPQKTDFACVYPKPEKNTMEDVMMQMAISSLGYKVVFGSKEWINLEIKRAKISNTYECENFEDTIKTLDAAREVQKQNLPLIPVWINKAKAKIFTAKKEQEHSL